MKQDSDARLTSRRSFLKKAAAGGAALGVLYVAPEFSTSRARPAYASITGAAIHAFTDVPNGSFEDGVTSPDHWKISETSVWDTTVVYDGSKSVKLGAVPLWNPALSRCELEFPHLSSEVFQVDPTMNTHFDFFSRHSTDSTVFTDLDADLNLFDADLNFLDSVPYVHSNIFFAGWWWHTINIGPDQSISWPEGAACALIVAGVRPFSPETFDEAACKEVVLMRYVDAFRAIAI